MKNEWYMMTVVGAVAGGGISAVEYFFWCASIPYWDWGILFGGVLGFISVVLAFTVFRYPRLAGWSLVTTGILLLIMALIPAPAGNLEWVAHGWHGAFEHEGPIRPFLAAGVLLGGFSALAGRRKTNPPDDIEDTMRDYPGSTNATSEDNERW